MISSNAMAHMGFLQEGSPPFHHIPIRKPLKSARVARGGQGRSASLIPFADPGDDNPVAVFRRDRKYKTPRGERGFGMFDAWRGTGGKASRGRCTISPEGLAANYTEVYLTAKRSSFGGWCCKNALACRARLVINRGVIFDGGFRGRGGTI